MRIVDVRAGHETEDIAEGRKTIQLELDHPSKNVMVICGRTPEVSHFADRAAVRTDAFPWRSAVWVKAPDQILTKQQFKEWFKDDDASCAVVFDFHDTPVARLKVTASLTAIEDAYLLAQGVGS